MRHLTKWRVIILYIVACMVILHNSLAQAGIGVQQPVTEIEVSPNIEKSGVFTVANGDSESVVIKVEPEDWLKLRTGKSPIPVAGWFAMKPEFKLGPGETRDVGYTVKVPEGVKGELVAQVFFSTGAATGGTLKVTSRFGVALYVGIEGTEIIDPEIKDMSLGGSAISVTIENHGNVHIRPSGKVTIKDSKGNAAQEVDVSYTAVIFSGQAHTYNAEVDVKKLSPGEKYTLEADFTTGTIFGKTKSFSKVVSVPYKIDVLAVKR